MRAVCLLSRRALKAPRSTSAPPFSKPNRRGPICRSSSPIEELRRASGRGTSHRLPTSPSSGLGLGLNLASNIMEAHDGEVVAESAGEGRGSRFSICLPTADYSEPRIGPRQA